ncbi:MAG TPA: sodium:proton antiporter [Oscillatoriaceae cyanobacterium]
MPHTLALGSFIWLLLVASLVAIVSERLRFPYAIGLVVVGLGLASGPLLPPVRLEPHTLFTLFLPPLLFETAVQLDAHELRRDWIPITLLALFGTLASALLVGSMTAYFVALPLAVALVFGAIVSPTDPISVIAILKRLNVSRRLMLLVESESLFNDGVALVLFTSLLALAQGGAASPWDAAGRFFSVMLGGAGIGALAGALASRLVRVGNTPLLGLLVTTVLAFGSYMVADACGVSGVVAVVAAGGVFGNLAWRRREEHEAREVVETFWEYAAFVVNSIVFLLIGMEETRWHWWLLPGAVLSAILAVLVARAVSVYALSWLSGALGAPIPRTWQNLLVWGGLRGALSMAMALGLPADFPQRGLILGMTFGYVLFSLIVQGLTAGPMIRWLRLSGEPAPEQAEGA